MAAMKLLHASAVIAALVITARADAQTLSGTVLDAYTSARLGGVTVVDSNSKATVQTDASGRFSIACTSPTILVVRKLGFQSTQRAVANCADSVAIALVPGAQRLAETNIVATVETPTIERPQSVAVLSPQALQRGSGLFFDQAINLTPGIRMQRRTMFGGQTITIRGYGTGDDAGNFTGRGFKAYLNGIPVTDAEGETVLDDVDMATLGRVEVIRGPASSLYGAGIGGVVNMYTATPYREGVTVEQETTAGSYGLLRSDTRLANVSTNSTTMLDYGHQGYDSYRIHSGSKKDYVTFLGEFRPSDRRRISTYANYARSRDDRAGELDSAQFAQKLNTGEDRYLQNDAHQATEGGRAGITQRYRFNDQVENTFTAYYTGRTQEDVFAAGLNSGSTQNFGGRTTFLTNLRAGTLPLRGETGAEFQKTNGLARGYGMSNGVLGGLRSDIETSTMQYSVFSQWDAALPSAFTLTAGASLDFVEYSIIDRMANSANPTHLDGSGRKTFDPVVTPTVALRKMFTPNLSAYASVSQGYTPPTASDAVIPFTGEPNANLEPERATQFEIGSKGNLLGNRLSFEAALFDLRVKDKLSSQAVFDTDNTVLYSYTVNAGDQTDRGLELSAGYSLIDDPAAFVSKLRPFATYTYSDFTYDHFLSNANSSDAVAVDYDGNRVVGVARNVFNLGLDASLRSGVYGDVTFHRTDGMPISYDNNHWAPGYSLLGAKLGVARPLGNRFDLNAFIGGNNLTSSLYYTQVFLNHKWDSQAAPHMYLPGPYSATFFAGVKLGFRP
jgi:iron complex outermembrane receptor protein